MSTYAGNGRSGLGGDGGPATMADLEPVSICWSREGELYIADQGTIRIRKVDASGVITTVVDNDRFLVGNQGTSKSFVPLHFVFVDDAGNLYFNGLHKILKRTPNGSIVVVAGNGTPGYTGDGGPAEAAALRLPEDVFVDGSGSIYISDTGNYRIRRVDPDGRITTVAGNGRRGFRGDGGKATSAQLMEPVSIYVDDSGTIYFTDLHRIRRVGSNGIIQTIAGTGRRGFSGDGGPAISARLDFPTGVFVDRSGAVYVSDSMNYRIRKLTRNPN